MIFLHGGGFAQQSGNSYQFGPDFLIEKGVILITLNSRLGVFGYLSLGTPKYSGNMGLKDQQLALKWIYSNIKSFSGDTRRITLFGVSSGSALTHYHILSRASRKYFRNAILMSGTVNNFWALYGKSDHLQLAYEITMDSGYSVNSLGELILFLKTAPASFIISQIAKYTAGGGFERRTAQIQLAPIVESKC